MAIEKIWPLTIISSACTFRGSTASSPRRTSSPDRPASAMLSACCAATALEADRWLMHVLLAAEAIYVSAARVACCTEVNRNSASRICCQHCNDADTHCVTAMANAPGRS